jgi:hypothetical protein
MTILVLKNKTNGTTWTKQIIDQDHNNGAVDDNNKDNASSCNYNNDRKHSFLQQQQDYQPWMTATVATKNHDTDEVVVVAAL